VLSQDSLERAAHAAGIDVPPRFLEETSSTNAVALELAAEGAPEWTVVAAGHQTAGRGRLGRSWDSAPGRSLLFSMVLRPPLPPHRAPLVSLLAAAAMAEACPGLPGGPVRTKWPNDLLAGDRKFGGILPEGRVEGRTLRYLVLGLGVNVSTAGEDFPEELRASATSLALAGAAVEPEDLLTGFLKGFRAAYRPADPDFGAHALFRYRGTCATIGRRVRARTTDGREVEGTAVDLDRDGGLAIEADGARSTVAFGEIAHLD
jgi:BirA family transcriptional regulator, biotin operon repressor / biotin---[acetyl-CoA-carboxylase] ligase